MAPPNAPLVLLVEDHADTRTMYALYLRVSGFEVLEAADAEEGLASARLARPAVVVTDLSMPGPTPVLDGRGMRGPHAITNLKGALFGFGSRIPLQLPPSR
jgi:CheY-like chemotaxis protein